MQSDEEHDSDASFIDDDEDEDEQLRALRPQQSKQTKKRKLRASAPAAFGATLQNLLKTDVPSETPLALKPAPSNKPAHEKPVAALVREKKEFEDKGRIRDIYEGWGVESERSLRKVAQRGVVQLFNAIQQSQNSTVSVLEQQKSLKGSGKATLPAPSGDQKRKGKVKSKDRDNILGRGKEAIAPTDFFESIKAGSLVSNV